MSDMRYYKRCNNTYYKCCYKPQENRLAYRFLYSRTAPAFLHPGPDPNGLERLIRTLVHQPNEKKRLFKVVTLAFASRYPNPKKLQPK
jgi:hypothetical protein